MLVWGVKDLVLVVRTSGLAGAGASSEPVEPEAGGIPRECWDWVGEILWFSTKPTDLVIDVYVLSNPESSP